MKFHTAHGNQLSAFGRYQRPDEGRFQEVDGVDKVIRISRPYKLVSREISSASKIIKVGNVEIGGADLQSWPVRALWKMKNRS